MELNTISLKFDCVVIANDSSEIRVNIDGASAHGY